MKRSTARWTTALAASALLGLPATGRAQSSQPATNRAGQQPPATSTAPASPASSTSTEAQQHLRQAKAALDGIDASAVTGRARTQIAELKRHLSSLERSAMTPAGATRSASGVSAKSSGWASEVAAIDGILNGLVGSTATGGDVAVGTSGTGASKAADAVTIDDATRSKLAEVRTHVTQFAAAMSGTASSPTAASAASAPDASSGSSSSGSATAGSAAAAPAT